MQFRIKNKTIFIISLIMSIAFLYGTYYCSKENLVVGNPLSYIFYLFCFVVHLIPFFLGYGGLSILLIYLYYIILCLGLTIFLSRILNKLFKIKSNAYD